jgi:hypothetical protein
MNRYWFSSSRSGRKAAPIMATAFAGSADMLTPDNAEGLREVRQNQ